VNCPQCGIKTAFKKGKTLTVARPSAKNSAPYDWTRTYRKGQTMTHPTFGFGEVTAVIEPQKIDVLFSSDLRRRTSSDSGFLTQPLSHSTTKAIRVSTVKAASVLLFQNHSQFIQGQPLHSLR
jgi:hypothetical protein